MPALENFVAVDWRAGRDKIYFFFKDTNTYSRFDLGDNTVEKGYPTDINAHNWHDFHSHAKHLRFGFSANAQAPNPGKETTGGFDPDFLWLFYYEGDIPMVCKYDQDTDKVSVTRPVKNSIWHQLLPYFDRIVAGTWWYKPGRPSVFRFILSDGTFLHLDLQPEAATHKLHKISHIPITNSDYPGLERYKHRIIGAVQNDYPLFNRYYYIFLTNNEYIRYSIDNNRTETGPLKVNDESWPGLLRD